MTKDLFISTQDSKLSRGNDCPGLSVTLRSHDDLLSRGNNVIAPGQAHGQLITMNLSEFVSFLHKLLQTMNFKHVYLLLVLNGIIYWEIYSKH